MKKRQVKKSRTKAIILILAAFIFVIFILLPIIVSVFDGSKFGNIARIPIEGIITSNGASPFGTSAISSETIVSFIKEAETNPQIKVILIEINSPGGSPVATDEIATAIKKTEKPTIALIREVGASGGYWIASAADHVIANRMSITGSIGVLSSYLEFSGLMEDYGVSYERLVAGESKDMPTPFRKLKDNEREIIQKKINRIHDFFIEGVAANRNLPIKEVKELATGEFYLGIEAFELGLIDQLGDKDSAEDYIKDTYKIEDLDYVVYERERGFFEMLTGVFANFFFNIGEGFGATILKDKNSLMLI